MDIEWTLDALPTPALVEIGAMAEAAWAFARNHGYIIDNAAESERREIAREIILKDAPDLEPWQLDAVTEVVCDPEARVRICRLEIENSAISGPYDAMYFMGPLLSAWARHADRDEPVIIDCFSNDVSSGRLFIIGKNGWSDTGTDEMMDDPLSVIAERIRNVSGIEMAKAHIARAGQAVLALEEREAAKQKKVGRLLPRY